MFGKISFWRECEIVTTHFFNESRKKLTLAQITNYFDVFHFDF